MTILSLLPLNLQINYWLSYQTFSDVALPHTAQNFILSIVLSILTTALLSFAINIEVYCGVGGPSTSTIGLVILQGAATYF